MAVPETVPVALYGEGLFADFSSREEPSPTRIHPTIAKLRAQGVSRGVAPQHHPEVSVTISQVLKFPHQGLVLSWLRIEYVKHCDPHY